MAKQNDLTRQIVRKNELKSLRFILRKCIFKYVQNTNNFIITLFA